MTDAVAVEPQGIAIAGKFNWLRAGVLGANNGILSTAALIFGIAGAQAAHDTIVLAGIAAITAGAMSMAVGEYVSVSSQRELEEAELAREREQIAAGRTSSSSSSHWRSRRAEWSGGWRSKSPFS